MDVIIYFPISLDNGKWRELSDWNVVKSMKKSDHQSLGRGDINDRFGCSKQLGKSRLSGGSDSIDL
jgi:hypothetical protein